MCLKLKLHAEITHEFMLQSFKLPKQKLWLVHGAIILVFKV
uniref:Uncharacterized protein n=1 Tax=Arundo donax TaxID=35708 RepID=A0A0A8ZRT8_ARUDO